MFLALRRIIGIREIRLFSAIIGNLQFESTVSRTEAVLRRVKGDVPLEWATPIKAARAFMQERNSLLHASWVFVTGEEQLQLWGRRGLPSSLSTKEIIEMAARGERVNAQLLDLVAAQPGWVDSPVVDVR